MKCRKCGQPGHFTKDCRGADAPPAQTPPPAMAQPRPEPPVAKPEPVATPTPECPPVTAPKPAVGGPRCRNCGQTGHYTKDCTGGAAPAPPPTPAVEQPQKEQSPPKAQEPKEEPKAEPPAPVCPKVEEKPQPPSQSKFAPKCRICGEGHFTKDHDTAIAAPKAEAPKPEAPKPEAPKPEAPKAEEPKAAEPPAGESDADREMRERIEKARAKRLAAEKEEAASKAIADAEAAEKAAKEAEEAKKRAAEEAIRQKEEEERAIQEAKERKQKEIEDKKAKLAPTAEDLERMKEIARQAQIAAEMEAQALAEKQVPLTEEQHVEKFYSKSRPERRNLFKELATASLFTIELDSFVLEILANTALDFTTGGQTLPIIFNAERLLHKLLERGARYEFVVFECHAQFWDSFPLGALLRATLICHLEKACHLTFNTFPNYWCDAWVQYLHAQKPGFVMSNDGEQARAVLGEEKGESVAFLLRAFMIHCCPGRWNAEISPSPLHLVFTSRIVFRGTKADVWVVRGHSMQIDYVEPFWAAVHQKVKDQLAQQAPAISAETKDRFAQLLAKGPAYKVYGGRILAGVCAAADLLKAGAQPKGLVKAFLVHMVLQHSVPLGWRVQAFSAQPPKAYLDFVEAMLGAMVGYTQVYGEGDVQMGTDIIDSFDGRLFYQLVNSLATNPSMDLGLPELAVTNIGEAWTEVLTMAGQPQEPLFPIGEVTPVVLIEQEPEEEGKSLPHSTLTTEVTGLKAKDLVRPKLVESVCKDDTFFSEWDLECERTRGLDCMEDVSVKKNPKVEAETDEYRRKKKMQAEERKKQVMASTLLKHATSLEGGVFLASGEILTAVKEDEKEKKKEEKKKEKEKEKATKEDKKKEKEEKKKEKEDKKNDKKGKKPEKESLKDKIKRENEELQQAKLLDKETKRWQSFTKQLDRNKRKAIKQIDNDFLKKCECQEVALDARLHRLKLYAELWKDYCTEFTTNRAYMLACMVLQSCQQLVQKHAEIMPKEKKQELLEILIRMGLKDNATVIAASLGVPVPSTSSHKLIDVNMTTTRLQMQHMGHLLQRPISDCEDSRVGFRPDLWQQQLLDIIDNNESALVCAPTSSGKTFISYYCMKKVLRASDDGLVIFCAPNKQLAHQVKADVYAHFRSKTYRTPGWQLYGEYTSDWQNVDTCQILITAPEFLQTLLTNQKLYASIAKRLQYLIVDEVHCIDELENGALWERLLMLLRCPFLALSATIGNNDEFHGWLERCQNVVKCHDEEEHKGKLKRSYKVHKIPDGVNTKDITRYSDLQKYVYIPKTAEEKTKWTTCKPKVIESALGDANFTPIHPVSCVTVDGLARSGFPGDLGFVPRESLHLYDTMQEVAAKDPAAKKDMAKLEPEGFFKGMANIDQKTARKYEKEIKAEIRAWSQDEERKELCQEVLDVHYSHFHNAVSKGADTRMDTDEWLSNNLIHLMTSLAAEDKLPALFFNFEETTCENLAREVVLFLEAKETEYRETPAFKKAMLDLAKRQKEAELRAKRHEKQSSNKKDEDFSEQDEVLDLSDLGDLREKDVLPQFTFVKTEYGEGLDEEELTDILRNVERIFPKEHILYRSLMRGIGVHHSGLPYKYRQAVEMLFRAKHIKAVLSTETLALGIHMPCRTVVFGGDHLQLNPLQFRQMSGRAGRRGFDLLGHVIFYGIPEAKIHRLMTSAIQRLQGHWPLTPALVHRLLSLYTHPSNKEKMQKRVQHQMASLWMAPLISVSHPTDPSGEAGEVMRRERTISQVRLYFSAMVDVLMQSEFIDSDGQGYKFNDVAAKLYRYDPAHFVFLNLMQQGYIHAMCEPFQYISTAEKFALAREDLEKRIAINENVLEKMLLLMCHIISRREIHRAVLLDKSLESESVHQVYLPALPDDLHDAIQSFHKQGMSCLTAYAINCARGLEDTKTSPVMPLSKASYEGVADAAEGTFVASLKSKAVPFQARSPFCALAGKGDKYDTHMELVQGVNDGINIDSEMIPTYEQTDTSPADKGVLLLNATVYDYQHSQSQDDVHKFNGLNYKESYQDLNRFDMFLTRVYTIFQKLESLDKDAEDDNKEKGERESKVLHVLGELQRRFHEAYSLADSKAASQEEKKNKQKTTEKKAKRPPLIKKDPRRFQRR